MNISKLPMKWRDLCVSLCPCGRAGAYVRVCTDICVRYRAFCVCTFAFVEAMEEQFLCAWPVNCWDVCVLLVQCALVQATASAAQRSNS